MTGIVVDITVCDGEKWYIVEDDVRDKKGYYNIYDCKSADIELLAKG